MYIRGNIGNLQKDNVHGCVHQQAIIMFKCYIFRISNLQNIQKIQSRAENCEQTFFVRSRWLPSYLWLILWSWSIDRWVLINHQFPARSWTIFCIFLPVRSEYQSYVDFQVKNVKKIDHDHGKRLLKIVDQLWPNGQYLKVIKSIIIMAES